MSGVCPCCHRALPEGYVPLEAVADTLRYSCTSRAFAAIVKCLARDHRPLAGTELARRAKMASAKSVAVAVHMHRHLLPPFGWKIVSRRGAMGGYYLAPLPPRKSTSTRPQTASVEAQL